MGIHANLKAPPADKSSSEQEVNCAADNDAASADLNRQRIETLLLLEAEVRQCSSIRQLQYLITNETAKLIPARQSILLHGEGKLSIKSISSLASLDKTSPALNWLQETISALPEPSPDEADEISHASLAKLKSDTAPGGNWPFSEAMQVDLPLKSKAGKAKIVFLNEKPYSQPDITMANRLADTYAHAWNALVKTPFKLNKLTNKKMSAIISLLVLIALFFPVHMTVLAPVEIIARDPAIVAAPLTGVIESVAVDPNTHISKGDLLFTYTSTDLDNEFKIARQNVNVAKSRYLRASQDAFATGAGRREMAQLNSELNLSIAKFKYAQSRLALSRVHATKNGVILYSDKHDWVGRPVSTGEKIMRIANPANIEYRINLPIADSIVLEDGNNVRIFLDVDPLNPVNAIIKRRSYQAKPDAMNNLVFQLIARGNDNNSNANAISSRIGVRGTAQIFGDKVPLAMFLFRKPLSALRQSVGF